MTTAGNGSKPEPVPKRDPKAPIPDFDKVKVLSNGTERVDFKDTLLAETKPVLLIDDSPSMWTNRGWETVLKIAPLLSDTLIGNCKNGIDIFFLNHQSGEQGSKGDGMPGTGYLKIQNPEFVIELLKDIEPSGSTPTPARLELILNSYIHGYKKLRASKKNVPPLNLIVITDGVCDNAPFLNEDYTTEDPLKKVIVKASRELDRLKAPGYQAGIQLFQVALDSGVEEWFQYLDDQLKGSRIVSKNKLKNVYRKARGTDTIKRDMIDTVNYRDIENQGGFTVPNLLKITTAAIDRRRDEVDVGQNTGFGTFT